MRTKLRCQKGCTCVKVLTFFNKPAGEVLSHSWGGDESAVPLLVG